MYNYRITKYNPRFRNIDGFFINDEWTSVSDVGKSYNGAILEFSEYLKLENAYISAIHILMKLNNVNFLRLTEIEKSKIAVDYPDISIINSREYIQKIRNNQNFSYSNIDLLVRLILREMVWGKLICDDMYVHFGYDYYMYIGSRDNLRTEAKIISGLGLFVEEVPSLSI